MIKYNLIIQFLDNIFIYFDIYGKPAGASNITKWIVCDNISSYNISISYIHSLIAQKKYSSTLFKNRHLYYYFNKRFFSEYLTLINNYLH